MAVRVVVVDDSVVVRRSVVACVDAQDDMEVVGTASNGLRALERIEQTEPDVVVLDIEMPELDGLATLSRVRATWPGLPVVMYSSLTESGASATIEALSRGASDYATKPSGLSDRAAVTAHIDQTLVPLLRLWGGPGRRTDPMLTSQVPRADAAPPTPPVLARAARRAELVVLGVSTGGPDALAQLVPALPASFAVPVVVVQHMPPVFTAMLAQRLDRLSALAVSEAQDGQTAEPGHVYIAPGGRHTSLRGPLSAPVIVLSDGPPENSCRPAVDVLFRSASSLGGAVLAVVLTGMGQDGLKGAREISRLGGTVFAQDEATSVVWGMPGFVAREGIASAVLPLPDLAGAMLHATAVRVGAGSAR